MKSDLRDLRYVDRKGTEFRIQQTEVGEAGDYFFCHRELRGHGEKKEKIQNTECEVCKAGRYFMFLVRIIIISEGEHIHEHRANGRF